MAVIASGGASSAAGGAITTGSFDTTGALFLVAHVADFFINPRSVVTDSKGNTWTGLTSFGTGFVRSTLWYTFTGNVGTGHTFTATPPAGITFPSIQIIAFDNSLVGFDQEVGNTKTGSPTEVQVGSITPPGNGYLFISGLCFDNTETSANVSIDSGFTRQVFIDFVSGASFGGSLAYLEQGTAGAIDPLWNYVISSSAAATMATFEGSAPAAAEKSEFFVITG